MKLGREARIGVSLLAGAPFAFLFLVYVRVFPNVTSDLEQIAVYLVAGMILGGASLVYHGTRQESQKITRETTTRNVRAVPLNSRFTRCDEFHGWTSNHIYELGQIIFYYVNFKGLLRAGYYETVIVQPNGKVSYCWDTQTLHYARPEQKGELSGPVNHSNYRWGCEVQMDSSPGEYTAHIGVYDFYPLDWATGFRVKVRKNWLIRKVFRKDPNLLAAPARVPVAQETVRFTVVRKLPSQGLST